MFVQNTFKHRWHVCAQWAAASHHVVLSNEASELETSLLTKKSNFIATTSQQQQQLNNSSVWTRRTGSRAITNVCIINITSCSFAILVSVFPPLYSDSSHTMWWWLGPLWRIHRPQNRYLFLILVSSNIIFLQTCDDIYSFLMLMIHADVCGYDSGTEHARSWHTASSRCAVASSNCKSWQLEIEKSWGAWTVRRFLHKPRAITFLTCNLLLVGAEQRPTSLTWAGDG